MNSKYLSLHISVEGLTLPFDFTSKMHLNAIFFIITVFAPNVQKPTQEKIM